jgi:hypothetical protein
MGPTNHKSLSRKMGVASTEYILITVAVLMTLGALSAGSTQTCVSYQNDQHRETCESVFDRISESFTTNLSITTTLLQLPL